ncbi:MAG: hypothetical protein DRJ51_08445 [Thermoprotei archaeon]|nr:MAG: hypothetical protein DRJ51_08445 [Thermoprotei archaeon]RLE81091.1 MAG: hypothetical protein DRJ36_01660 [Thermoprotei archaeon]RLF02651.1 MAG: hypothetical protein DRJ59_03015 [Thermoprotei archaeon]
MIKVIEEELLTLPEVKRLLQEKAKRMELSSTEQLTLDYATKFSKLEAEDAKTLLEKLLEFGMKKETAVQIVNILPENEEELRTLLMMEEKFFSGEELKAMIELIGKFRLKSSS